MEPARITTRLRPVIITRVEKGRNGKGRGDGRLGSSPPTKRTAPIGIGPKPRRTRSLRLYEWNGIRRLGANRVAVRVPLIYDWEY